MVFISHKYSTDREWAERIADVLRKNGVSCWLAPKSIEPNRDFAEEIPRAIISCEYFLLILSKETMESEHVRTEIGIAMDLKKPFIIMKRGDFGLTYRYTYLISQRQFLQFDWDNPDYTELINKCKCGERVVTMETNREAKRSITVIKGDFQENMRYMIENRPEELSETVFAIGIDCSSKLSVSTDGGVIKDVCGFLSTEYGTTVDELQSLIDKAKAEQTDTKDKPLEFKDSVLISVPIKVRGSESSDRTLHFLLIANSRKSAKYYETGDKNDIEGTDSREIIIEVFNKFTRLHGMRNLFIGAMGTNRLKFPYEVITAEIMNCFVFAQRMNIAPYNLYYSVRESDMKNYEMTVDDMMSYISRSISFFK